MKKSELLKAIPKELPEDNTARIIKACKKKVLMLILPEWEIVGKNETGVIHFTWDEGWLTYYPEGGFWTRDQLTTVFYNAHVSRTAFDEDSLEAIGTFCNSAYRSMDEICSYESNIKWEKSSRALDRKQKRIDDFMKNVPALPKDFKRFCIRKLEESDEEKINIKLWQPYTYTHIVSGIKFYEERYIERIFSVTNFHTNKRDISEAHITELCRAYTKEVAGQWIRWYYGEKFGRYGQNQHFGDKKRDSCVNNLPARHFIYNNLDSLGLPKGEKETLKLLDGKCDPSIVLQKFRRNPQIEYIAKKGCLRMAADLVDRYGVTPINVSNAIFDRCRKFNGGMEARELLEAAPRISDKYFKDFCKIRDTYKTSLIIGLSKAHNINHVYALLLKTGGMTTANIREYEDYLNMARRLGMNPNDEIIYRNKRWKEFHDRYIEEIEKEKLKEKNLTENRKYKEIKKDYKLNLLLFGWEDDDYKVIVPKNAGDINEEGRLQHHCVGSHEGYKQKMCRRESFIVFLRKKDDLKKPYYTIECNYSRVIQFYAAYDRQPDKEIVQKVLNRWMRQVKKNAKKLTKAAG